MEEQFYLLWPVAMLLLKTNRTRLKIAALLVLVAPIWRFVNFHWLGTPATINSLRFDLRYDAILIGCCLALLRNDPALARYLQRGILQSRWIPLAALACLIASVGLGYESTIAYLFVAILINYVVDHSEGWARPLNWEPIAWVGRLSFSLYIWQQLFCTAHAHVPTAHMSLAWAAGFPQNLLFTFAMASLSYYLVEQPFAKLRKHVRLVPGPPKIRIQGSLAAGDSSIT